MPAIIDLKRGYGLDNATRKCETIITTIKSEKNSPEIISGLLKKMPDLPITDVALKEIKDKGAPPLFNTFCSFLNQLTSTSRKMEI